MPRLFFLKKIVLFSQLPPIDQKGVSFSFMSKVIKIKGAREHNLKGIDLEIPRDKMTVFTGVSGSGKTSLAFDTVFAEGQRRYVESLSSYARQFLTKMSKPDVENIEGLSPAISIDQKAGSRNPRSIVATVTEIYDFLRVIFSSAGIPYCPKCKREIQPLSSEQITDSIIKLSSKEEELVIMAQVVRGRKGEYYQLLYNLLNDGFREVQIDGKFHSLRDRIVMERYKTHDISVVVDRIPAQIDFKDKENRTRLFEAVETALLKGNGFLTLLLPKEGKEKIFSQRLSCPYDNFAYPAIEPRLFSFNSPYGACPECRGLGLESRNSEKPCPVCQGKRLRPEALSVLLKGKNIVEVTSFTVKEASEFFSDLEEGLTENQKIIVKAPLRDIKQRIKFLEEVGLDYLGLDRKAGTLSGGEAQRIRLASQIGSGLVGTLYILDEPTIGLHQHDNYRLVNTLKKLRDLGNTIIVVEHDEGTILSSDYLVDFGPGAGIHGGEIVASGEMPKLLKDKSKDSLTLKYLRKEKEIPLPERRRKVDKTTPKIKVRGASENNLKNINVDLPLRRMVAITGVSGSGKSSFLYQTLFKFASQKIYGSKAEPGKVKDIKGLEYVDKVVNIDQSPIGRTPRSTPVTYVGAWTDIRDLFSWTEEAKMRGWGRGRFSFNTPGGRCEHCRGYGHLLVEMHFLPTVEVICDICQGKRFDQETLEIKYRGKDIYQILEMTIEEGMNFFKDTPWIYRKLKILFDVGLGYLTLGQGSPSLSGGEAQRIKLAAELAKKDTRKTLYLLDEPTVGLHYEDVRKLLEVLDRLVERGNTVVIIEHNLEVIKHADYIIDFGPGGGDKGGEIVIIGTPEEVKRKGGSLTGEYLRKVM